MYPYHNRIKQRIKNGELVGNRFRDPGKWTMQEVYAVYDLLNISPLDICEYFPREGKTMKIKGFNKKLCCRGVQFEVGKIYDTGAKDNEIKLCSNTVYHYCDNIEQVHVHYSCNPAHQNRFCEIEVLGAEVTDGEKCGSNKIKIIREIVGDELKTLIGQINGNTGLFNSGDWNSGDCNSGNRNSGDCNSGNRNSGNWNSGNWNSGDWNSCNGSNGVFCNQEDKDIRIFNKPSGMSLQEFKRSKYYNALTSKPFELIYWDEKNKKLKCRSYKDACTIWRSELTEENKKIIQEIPNFDPDVFLDITGIDIREDIK